MKSIRLLVFLLAVGTFAYGQNFEGKITYKSEYKSKMSNVTDAQFTTMMGTTQEYYIKGGNYKSIADGTVYQWQVYNNKENRLYNKLSSSPTILWIDGSANADSVISSQVNRGVVTILGYKCDELILTCQSGIQKYYFSTKLGIDPKLYENHKFGNWSEFVSKAKGLPLKMTVENQQFWMETVAVEVKAMKLEGKFFELPADSKVEKSPY